MSKTVKWAEMDKRIRARRRDSSAEDDKAIDAALAKLPDLAEEVEIIDIPQPAVTDEEEAADGEAEETPADAPN